MASDYSEAIKLFPGEPWYWHERGYAHLVLGEHQKSVEDHSRAIELSDRDPGQRIRRGHSHQALGAFQEAQKDWARAIELIPGETADEHLARLRTEAEDLIRQSKTADVQNGISRGLSERSGFFAAGARHTHAPIRAEEFKPGEPGIGLRDQSRSAHLPACFAATAGEPGRKGATGLGPRRG